MATKPPPYDYQHLVSINKFDTSIERVMTHMWSLLGKDRQQSLFPTLVGIDVDYRGHADAIVPLRNFLNNLQKIQSKHFVRFVTDTLWAMETKCGHQFYTHDGPKNEWCDIVWMLNVVSPDQIDIGFKVPANKSRQDLLSELSGSLRTLVKASKNGSSRSELCDIMAHFYHTTKRVSQVKYLQENLHILLLPTGKGNGFYPVPLYGMSYFDAKRRQRQVDQVAQSYRRNYYEYFIDEPSVGDTLCNVLGLIQENDNFGVKPNVVAETYGLAEMVFGLYAAHTSLDTSRHDIILFDIIDKNMKDVEVIMLSMSDVKDRS